MKHVCSLLVTLMFLSGCAQLSKQRPAYEPKTVYFSPLLPGEYQTREEFDLAEQARLKMEKENRDFVREQKRLEDVALEERRLLQDFESKERDKLTLQESTFRSDFESSLKTSRDGVLRQELGKRGFKTIEVGLIPFLERVRSESIPTAKLRDHLIQISTSDKAMETLQVIGRKALMSGGGAIILLDGYDGSLYEKSPITSLSFSAVQVVGIQHYRSVIGSSKQAFVVRPVKDIDISDEVIRERTTSSVIDGYQGPLGFANFQDSKLLECITFSSGSPEDNRKRLKLLGPTVTPFRGTCQERFSRPPLDTCLGKGGGSFHFYDESVLNDFGRDRCGKLGGTWAGSPGSP